MLLPVPLENRCDFCLHLLHVCRSRCCWRLRGDFSLLLRLSGQPASPWEQVCFSSSCQLLWLGFHLEISGFQAPACSGQTLASLPLLWRPPSTPQKRLLFHPVPPAATDLPLTPTCPSSGLWTEQRTVTAVVRRSVPPPLSRRGEGCSMEQQLVSAPGLVISSCASCARSLLVKDGG